MKLILTIIFFLFLFSISAQSPDALKRQQQVEFSLAPEIIYGDSIPNYSIDSRMKTYNIKGLSIAVIKDYKLDWAKAWGWADEAEKRPATTSTRFQAASISKSLNSLGLMKLVQQGKIDPDADINNYLESWKFPYDSLSKNKKITLRNLLTHTAGLSVHGFRGYEMGDTLPSVIQILNGEKPANSPAIRSLFAPSTKYQYSGGGTTISQLILADITGQRYDDYMQKNVLTALGMTNSSYSQPTRIEPGQLATGYYGNGAPVKGKYHVYPEQAAAGLWTTPSDLAKYIIETQLAYEGKSSKVLSTAITKQRLNFYIDSAAALGSFLLRKGGITWFSHNGGNEGFVCTSYGSLQGGNGIVVMTNASNFGIISEVVNSVARVYQWKDFYNPTFRKILNLPADTLRLYTGSYLLGGDTLSFKVCDQTLCVQQNSQPPNGYELLFNTTTAAYIREAPGVKLTFIRSAEGKVDTLELNDNGRSFNFPRIK